MFFLLGRRAIWAPPEDALTISVKHATDLSR